MSNNDIVTSTFNYIDSLKQRERGGKYKTLQINQNIQNEIEKKLSFTKKSIVRNILLSRTLERSLVRHEKIQEKLKEHIQSENNKNGRLLMSKDRTIVSKKKKFSRNIADNKVWIDNETLSEIESFVSIPVGSLSLFQRLINKYDDSLLVERLHAVPDAVLNHLDFKLFWKIIDSVSSGHISEDEAIHLLNKARDASCINGDLWQVVCHMTRKILMTAFIASSYLEEKNKMLVSNFSTSLHSSSSFSSSTLSRSTSSLPSTSKRPLRDLKNSKKMDMSHLSTELANSKLKQKRIKDKILMNLTQVSQLALQGGDSFQSAVNFARHMGVRKMEIALQILSKYNMGVAIRKWKKFVEYFHAVRLTYKSLRYLGAFRLFHILELAYDNKLVRGVQRLLESKRHYEEVEIEAAILEIQRYWRGCIFRWHRWHEKENKRVVVIQKLVRGFAVRKKLDDVKYKKKLRDAVRMIERAWKNLVWHRIMKKRRELDRQNLATIKIQRIYRGYLGKERVRKIRLFRAQVAGAIRFQSLWRRYKAVIRVDFLRLHLKEVRASILIQSVIRRFLAWIVVQDKRERLAACKLIQRVFRGHQGRIRVRNIIRTLKAVVIQRVYRGHCGRQRCKQLRFHRDNFDRLQHSALVFVAPLLLGYRIRRRYRNEIKKRVQRKKMAATIIQRRLQALHLGGKVRLALKAERDRIQRDKEARRAKIIRKKLEERSAVSIQRVIRGFLGRRRVKRLAEEKKIEEEERARRVPMYFRLKEDYYRNLTLFCRTAAIKIQACYRGHLARLRVAKLRSERASVRIERMWRHFLAVRGAMKQLRQLRIEHARKVRMAIEIQRIIRGFMGRYEARKHYHAEIVKWFVRELRASGLIGRTLINFRLRKRELELMNAAATKIQSIIRRFLGRCWFLRSHKRLLRERAIRIKDMKIRQCIKIQSFWRRILATRRVEERRQFRKKEMEEAKLMCELESMIEDIHEDWLKELFAIRAQSGVRGLIARRLDRLLFVFVPSIDIVFIAFKFFLFICNLLFGFYLLTFADFVV